VTPYRLSASAETIFSDLPVLDRVRRLVDAGFAIELWDWQRHDVRALAALPGADYAICTGSITGSMVHPDGVASYLDGVRRSVGAAADLGCPRLTLLPGRVGPGGEILHDVAKEPASRWASTYRALSEIANLAEQHGLTFCIENLNTKRDHPGAAISTVGQALALARAVGSPSIRVLLDLYHAQVEEGNLVALLREAIDFIGHVQVADVPGRHEPGTGEIRYEAIAQELNVLGYAGGVGLEAFPLDSDEAALAAFRSVFSQRGRP